MQKLEKVIEGLEIVWHGMNAIEHELYADYVFDALEYLKGRSEPIEESNKEAEYKLQGFDEVMEALNKITIRRA